MRFMRNRNVLVVIAIILLVIAVAAVGWTMRVSEKAERETGDDSAPAAAPLYLLVTAGSTTYAPIQLIGENVFTLTQGEETVNVIHVTSDSIWMESSTCENQNCVEQGVVTAANRASRVLGNMIICLPNRVQLELFTADELREIGIVLPESADSDE